MAKYSKTIVAKICKLISSDSYTIAEICKMVNINIDTFYDWKNNKPEFSEAIKKAQGEYDELIVKTARKSMMKLLEGYDAEETKTVYVDTKEGKPKIKEQTKTKKHIQPHPTIVIFSLVNKDPENFQNKYNGDIKLKADVKTEVDLSQYTEEEKTELLKLARKYEPKR